MSLARTNSPLSKLIIRNIGDVGGPRSDHVDAELDNIIAWAKLSPRCIHRDTSTVGNVSTGLDPLHSFSLPANSLAANGDWVRATYAGEIAGNDNNKRIVVSFDAQVALDTGLQDFDLGPPVGWRIQVEYIRTGATTIRTALSGMIGQLMVDSAGAVVGAGVTSNGMFFPRSSILVTANLNSNAVTMLVQGETAAAVNNDVQQMMSIIELCQQ